MVSSWAQGQLTSLGQHVVRQRTRASSTLTLSCCWGVAAARRLLSVPFLKYEQEQQRLSQGHAGGLAACS